mmetsp:Transcript_55022/g.101840  ORF Transcript_55022/g.101840 Transcript_55022/m.101840 type:complete len:312 (+) Transcript_55022:101-1036(+)
MAVRRRIVKKSPVAPEARHQEIDARLRTLVINLDRRPDRWTACSDRLRPLQEANLLRVERLPATDGNAAQVPLDFVLKQWKTDVNAKYDGRPGYKAGVSLELTDGERGCAMSHIRAWQIVAKAKAPVLILEDDATFQPRFRVRLQRALTLTKEASVDALYLGYIAGAPWRSSFAPGLKWAEYLWTTVGYLLWPRGAKRLLDALPVEGPIDNFMAGRMATSCLDVLALVPPIVDQELEWDEGSDVSPPFMIWISTVCPCIVLAGEERRQRPRTEYHSKAGREGAQCGGTDDDVGTTQPPAQRREANEANERR